MRWISLPRWALRSPQVGSLARRQAWQVGLLATGALILSGLMQMYFSYGEALAQARSLQAVQASSAAREINQYLGAVILALRDTTKQPWGAPGFSLARQREDYQRVMVLFPAITEVQVLAPGGTELLMVSRGEPDRIADAVGHPTPTEQATRPLQARIGEPFFLNGSEPFVQVTLGGQAGTAKVQATLHLRLLADVVARLDETLSGRAYLVDGRDRLILHPEQTEMLRQRQLGDNAQVRKARSALAQRPVEGATVSIDGEDFEGREVVSTATLLPDTGWLLFLEQARSAVLAPVYATLWRTAAMVAVATALTAVAGAWGGRRMARPVLALRQASARIASGDFDTPLRLKTGDELELLADDLNQMARRLGRFYEELEEQVAVRTEELMQARDAAERASLAKTRFLAAASHDLRQPMHTIGLLLGVLEARVTDAQHKAITAKLSTSVETMERLFSSLLDISKLDAGAVRARPEAFPIQSLLDRMIQRFEPMAELRGLRLRVHACSGIVQSDPGLLERCLGNLVANALSYTVAGRVVLGCRRRGGLLFVQVHDSGVGIDAEHLDLVFEEFARLPGADTAQARGLGLGLAIVRRTAALLGHPLGVRSRPGRGSMFEIGVACSPEQVLHANDVTPSAVGDVLLGAFALIVDDDEGNRSALQALCTRWGCVVASAPTAEAALGELERHLRPPDLLLTDMQLGGPMNGLDLVVNLRAAVDEATPCLLITADTDAAVADRARRLGAQVLHKPASAEGLYLAACAALSRQPN